jgi:ABC-2 type transport system ATP-binding protein
VNPVNLSVAKESSVPIIEAHGLARTFRVRQHTVEAVRGVDLTVASGEIVGFLGPNGAGKTTTLRMLTTLLAPTAGTAVIAGHDLLRDPRGVRRQLGYVAQSGGTDPQSLVIEELVLQARLYRIGRAEAVRRAGVLAEQFDLGAVLQRPVRTLSGGQRRRLDLAMGLVHQPPLVFLDEPTTGLDPQSRGNLWEHVRRMREELGVTVFITTHYLDEADALCDRLLIIDQGRIVGEGTPEELKRRISGDVVTLTVGAEPERAAKLLGELDGVRDVAVTDSTLRLTVGSGEESLVEIMRTLDGAGVPLRSIQVARPTLDDVFLTLTGRSLREDATP